jgi:hypothetical protein
MGILDYLEMTAIWLSPINSIGPFIPAKGVVMVLFIIRRYSKKKPENHQT